jgi:enterochelin esterase-like enzyme
MQFRKTNPLTVESASIFSDHLDRQVFLEFYQTQPNSEGEMELLLVNDGQDLVSMHFENIIGALSQEGLLRPLLVVGIHCGEDRRNEYGMQAALDFKGRGSKAANYSAFIFEELLPFVYKAFPGQGFRKRSFAGFSLGALSAMDIVWNNPEVFTRVGSFSGSLWWRAKDNHAPDFNETRDRLMHNQIRKGKYIAGMKFFFQCGEADEFEDRNNNGVIDSIAETIDLMRDLLAIGYLEGPDMYYLQVPDGKHDVPSWAKAFPEFLLWGWGSE